MSEIKGLHSPDLGDLSAEGPPDPENCCVLIEVRVGPSGQIGEESFDVLVVTPQWLLDNLSDHDYVFARHYLIVRRYDYSLIKAAISEQFHGIQGASWSEVADQLARFGRWELEEYQPLGHQYDRNGA